MNRKEALELLYSHVDNPNLIKHMLATEICMRDLAEKYSQDTEEWALAGLLHDIDYKSTKDMPENHGLYASEILQEKGLPQSILNAVIAHAGHKDLETDMETALYAIDPFTGLIVAAALMHPDKKLESLTVKSIMKRFKDKRFAAGANREQINRCNDIGMGIEEFAQHCLLSMRKISKELGL